MSSLQVSNETNISNIVNTQTHYTLKSPYALTILAAYSVISAITNALLISAFLATKQAIVNTSNLLIFCISVFDLISSLFGIPAALIIHWNLSFIILGATFPITAGLTVLLALDRFLHMNPNVHQETMLSKMFKRPFVFMLIGVVIAIGFFFDIIFTVWSKASDSYPVLALCGNTLIFLSMVLISGLYTKGYLRIRCFADDSPVYRNEDGTIGRPKYVRNLFKTVFFLTVASIITYLPLTVVNTIYGAYLIQKHPPSQQLMEFNTYLFYWSFSNCCFNSLIIFYLNEPVRLWLVSKLFRRCFKKSEGTPGSHDCAERSTPET